MHVWARFGILGNYAVLLLGTWAVMWSLGKVPLGARNPVKVASGVGRALLAPRTGRVGGRPVRIRGPHRIQHSVSVRTIPVVRPTELPAHGRGEVSVAVGSPSLDSHPRTSAQGSPRSVTRRPALSGVQLLLAHGVSSRNAHQEH
jgi:hypothetical protein